MSGAWSQLNDRIIARITVLQAKLLATIEENFAQDDVFSMKWEEYLEEVEKYGHTEGDDCPLCQRIRQHMMGAIEMMMQGQQSG